LNWHALEAGGKLARRCYQPVRLSRHSQQVCRDWLRQRITHDMEYLFLGASEHPSGMAAHAAILKPTIITISHA
jgi:hypothetical protein